MHLDENLAFPRNRALDLLHPETVCDRSTTRTSHASPGLPAATTPQAGVFTIGLTMDDPSLQPEA
jgi:hypothetical protein